MNKRIVGVFTAEHEASWAIEELKRHGCRTEDISIIARNKNDANTLSDETGTQVPEGITSGAASGGLLGGVTGLLMGIGALAIPGIGPIIAAGPLAATLAGAAVGAGAGGLVGGLIGLGFPQEEAKNYDKYVSEGHILVMVDVEGEHKEQEIYQIFREFNALNAETREDITVEARTIEQNYERSESADDSVKDMVDAALNCSGLEGKEDTGLDTMNSAPVDPLSEDKVQHDMDKSAMRGNVEETDPLRAADQKEARNLAQASGTMDSMDTLASERVRNREAEKQSKEDQRREREMERFGNKW